MQRFIYEVCEGDELILKGHMDKLMTFLDVSEGAVSSAISTGRKINGWSVKKVSHFVEKDKVDYFKIRLKIREFGLKTVDLAEVLDITSVAVNNKLRKASRFRDSEIELLEDLFFLDEGELIKGIGE